MLYPHNRKTFELAYKKLVESGRCAIIQATGTGKTFIAMEFLDTLFDGLDVVYVVSNMSIAQGILMYEDWVYSNVRFVTYDGLKGLGRIPDVLVVDELHRAGAPTWETPVRELMSQVQYTLGLSATQFRYLDGRRDMAVELFGDDVVYGIGLQEAIDKGILNGFDYYAILGDTVEYVEEIAKKNPNEEIRSRLIKLNLSEYNLARRIRRRIPDKFRAIRFCKNASDLESADEDLKNWLGNDVVIFSIYSRNSQAKNRNQLEQFNRCPGNCVLKVVDMLNEGVHVVGVNVLLFTRRTESGNVFIQQLGRGLRVSKSAGRTKVIDIVQNYKNIRIIEQVFSKSKVAGTGGKGTKKEIKPDAVIQEVLVTYDDILLELDDILAKVNNVWTDEEDRILREYYLKEGREVCLRLDGKTADACSKRARVLGLHKNRKWSKIEDEILRERAFDLDVWKYLPGRTQNAIEKRKRDLGIIVPWSSHEDLILMKYWDTLGYDVRGYLNNRTLDEIDERVKKLNV